MGESMEFGMGRNENVHVQISTIKLTKDNYLKWYAAIKVEIAGMMNIKVLDVTIQQTNASRL